MIPPCPLKTIKLKRQSAPSFNGVPSMNGHAASPFIWVALSSRFHYFNLSKHQSPLLNVLLLTCHMDRGIRKWMYKNLESLQLVKYKSFNSHVLVCSVVFLRFSAIWVQVTDLQITHVAKTLINYLLSFGFSLNKVIFT